MQIIDTLQALKDRIVEHLGVKVRYSVQAQNRLGEWYDLNQDWDAKVARYSVQRNLADAKTWKKRYDAATKRNAPFAVPTRIVRQVTTFDVVA